MTKLINPIKAFADAKKAAAKKKRDAKKKRQSDFFILFVRSTCNLQLVAEHQFLEDRKFRFDYANIELKIAIEQNGGIWMKGGGAHSRPANIIRDMEKKNLANKAGWIVIEQTPDKMNTRETEELIKAAIQRQKQRNI